MHPQQIPTCITLLSRQGVSVIGWNASNYLPRAGAPVQHPSLGWLVFGTMSSTLLCPVKKIQQSNAGLFLRIKLKPKTPVSAELFYLDLESLLPFLMSPPPTLFRYCES